MRKNKYKELLCLILILIPFFKPTGLISYEVINNIFQVLKFFSIGLIIFYILRDKKIKKYFYLIYIIIFWIIYSLNSLIYGGNYLDIINNAVTCVILMIFIKKVFEENKEILFLSLKIIFSVYLILHILSVIIMNIFNIGLFDVNSITTYFLGQDNYSAFMAIPMITIVIFVGYFQEKNISWKYISLLLVLTFCYILTKSYTAALALVVLSIFIILLKLNINLLKYISVRNTTLVLTIILLLIIVFNIQNIFIYFLDNIGKGITLNSRTIIWKDSLELIAEKPLLGHGDLSTEKIDGYLLYGASHAHNFLLELLLRTGFIGTICYILFVDRAVKDSYKKEKTTIEISILILGLISYIIVLFMDFYPILQYQYCLLGILYCYYDEKIIDEKIKKTKLVWEKIRCKILKN